MNALGHTAAALIIKKRYPDVPVLPLVISTQIVELFWIAFNLIGVEKTAIDDPATFIGSVHLYHMPWSHSILSGLVFATIAWLVCAKGMNKPLWGIALALGVISHTALDVATHVPDMPIMPLVDLPKLGTGLFGIPVWALVVEMVWIAVCWRVFNGTKVFLAVLMGLSLANLSFYTPAITGPEQYMGGQPMLFVAVVFANVLLGFFIVHWGITQKEKAAR